MARKTKTEFPPGWREEKCKRCGGRFIWAPHVSGNSVALDFGSRVIAQVQNTRQGPRVKLTQGLVPHDCQTPQTPRQWIAACRGQETPGSTLEDWVSLATGGYPEIDEDTGAIYLDGRLLVGRALDELRARVARLPIPPHNTEGDLQ